jgi:lipoprotein NlpI
MCIRSLTFAALLCAVAWHATPLMAAETLDTYAGQVRKALEAGQPERALEIGGAAVVAYPKEAGAYLLRGTAYEALAQNAKAVADYTKCLELDEKMAEAYDRRGSAHFKLGKIAESVADFDRYLELHPEAKPGHWQRGISLYYAGKYDEGKKQFTSYEKVDTNDVENAVWHFLCAARQDGVKKAQANILKIGKDGRVPMMEVYALYKGELKPADVLAAAQGDELQGEKRKQALFYAHLYLGLYYDVTGDKAKALEHMTEAAGKYRIGHYMGDVARVHEEILRKENKPKDK